MIPQRFKLLQPPRHNNLLRLFRRRIIHQLIPQHHQPISTRLGRGLQQPQNEVEQTVVHGFAVFLGGVGGDSCVDEVELFLEDAVVGLLGDVVCEDLDVLLAGYFAVFDHVEEGFPD